LRGAFVAIEHGKVFAIFARVFEAYWGADRDVSRDEVLRDIVRAAGLDQDEFSRKFAAPEYKNKLRINTEELIARGGFRFAHDVRRRRDVLRQRPTGAGRASAVALSQGTWDRPRATERAIVFEPMHATRITGFRLAARARTHIHRAAARRHGGTGDRRR